MSERVYVSIDDDGIADVRLNRPDVAKELTFTGRILSGVEAVRAGLEGRPAKFRDPESI
jgi:hypothetical protein